MPAALLVLWNNKLIRYGLLIAIGLLFVYLAGRKKGKEKALEDLKIEPLPNNGGGIPVGWNPKPLANELFTKLDGLFTSSADKETAFARCMELSNDQLVAVYNTFNQLFSNKGKGTLTDWLRDEWSVAFGGVRDSLVNRLLTLNCL